MEARARCTAMLWVLFFIVLGAGKLQALAAGCVNIYDEADPNGSCMTSSCSSSCTNGGGGLGLLSSTETHSQTRRRNALTTPQILSATPLSTTLATNPDSLTSIGNTYIGQLWSQTKRVKVVRMFEEINLTEERGWK